MRMPFFSPADAAAGNSGAVIGSSGPMGNGAAAVGNSGGTLLGNSGEALGKTGVAAGSSGSVGNSAAAAAGKTGSAAAASGEALAPGSVTAGKTGAAAAAGKTAGATAGKAGAGKLAAVGAATKTGAGLLLALPLLGIALLVAGLFAMRGGKGKDKKPPAKPLQRSVRRRSMAKLIAGRIVIVILALVSIALLGTGASIAYKRFKTNTIAIAAGSSKAESYVMMQALKTVVERHYPRLKLTVQETGGTSESLQHLDRGESQLAAAQADVPAGPSATAVAVLFEDNFQLLVHKASPITQFTDLKGKKIGLARTGGQFRSFLFVAKHFGLREADFTFVGGDDESGDLAFARDEADAIFRVRGLHNAAITQLATGGNATFIPIEHASAMHVDSSAYKPTTIPKGAYLGNPPVPAVDLATVATDRLLLARADVDDEVIASITQVLMENRQEISDAISNNEQAVRPLVSQVTQPVFRAGSGPPVHPGALAFYDRNRSSFVAGHADMLTLGLIAFVLAGLWISELRRSSSQNQKNRADDYNRKIVDLMAEAQTAASHEELDPIRTELMTVLATAIQDLDMNLLSERSFQSFHTVWQVAMDVIRDGKSALAAPPSSAANPRAAQLSPGAVEAKPGRWSLTRLLTSKS